MLRFLSPHHQMTFFAIKDEEEARGLKPLVAKDLGSWE